LNFFYYSVGDQQMAWHWRFALITLQPYRRVIISSFQILKWPDATKTRWPLLSNSRSKTNEHLEYKKFSIWAPCRAHQVNSCQKGFQSLTSTSPCVQEKQSALEQRLFSAAREIVDWKTACIPRLIKSAKRAQEAKRRTPTFLVCDSENKYADTDTHRHTRIYAVGNKQNGKKKGNKKERKKKVRLAGTPSAASFFSFKTFLFFLFCCCYFPPVFSSPLVMRTVVTGYFNVCHHDRPEPLYVRGDGSDL
jgi:hypothetical protein